MKLHTSCNDEALLLFVHGELTPGARVRLLVHLAGCSVCRARLRQYARLSSQLARGLTQPGLPPRVSHAHSLPVPAPLWVVTVLAAAILASLGTLAWQVHKVYAPIAATGIIEDPASCPPPAGTPAADKFGSAPTKKHKKH